MSLWWEVQILTFLHEPCIWHFSDTQHVFVKLNEWTNEQMNLSNEAQSGIPFLLGSCFSAWIHWAVCKRLWTCLYTGGRLVTYIGKVRWQIRTLYVNRTAIPDLQLIARFLCLFILFFYFCFSRKKKCGFWKKNEIWFCNLIFERKKKLCKQTNKKPNKHFCKCFELWAVILWFLSIRYVFLKCCI